MNSYRFPIYLLGGTDAPIWRLDGITSWCVVKNGKELCDSNEEGAAEIYGRRVGSGKIPNGAPANWDDADPNARAVVVGQSLFSEEGGSVANYCDGHARAKGWIGTLSSRYGNPSFVSIGRDLIWEQIHQLRGTETSSLGWRQFTTLCAVNCAIGDKKYPFPVSRDFIRAASLGFKSGKGFFLPDGKPSEAALKTLKALRITDQFPTVQQTRDDLDQLESQKLIGRIVISRRATAFFRSDVCTREKALELAKKALNHGIDLKKRREEERRFLAKTTKNHPEPPSNQ